MKVVGKKNIEFGKNITKMLMVYMVVLIAVVGFTIVYKEQIFLWSTTLAVSVLVIERIVALIRFRRLPVDLVSMHRDCVEIKSNYTPRLVKYDQIKEIEVSPKSNKFYILTTYNTKIFVKFLDNPNMVKKEILDYKNKYYK